jgi:hypothetical protein
MGLFDKLKKTAQDALKTQPAAQPVAAEPEPQDDDDEGEDETEQETAAPTKQYDGPTFHYDGVALPLPPGWDGLSVEDWFFKLETLRDRIMHADEEDLQPMKNEDGDHLDPEEVVLVLEGFESGGHYEKFRNWGVQTWARKLGQDPTNLEFKMGGIAREKIMANQAGAMSGAGGALEPIEGVSCEQWAQINAGLAMGGGEMDKLLAGAGMDRPKWDRINAEWLARMSSDRTMAISTVYGNAFSGAGHGQFSAQAGHAANVGVGGDLSNEPMPFERYCEIEAAMACASERGEDVNELLAHFGLKAAEWGQLGMFWSKKMQQDAMGYHRLYTEYSAKYRAQYSV